jgi:hypothetical protein
LEVYFNGKVAAFNVIDSDWTHTSGEIPLPKSEKKADRYYNFQLQRGDRDRHRRQTAGQPTVPNRSPRATLQVAPNGHHSGALDASACKLTFASHIASAKPSKVAAVCADLLKNWTILKSALTKIDGDCKDNYKDQFEACDEIREAEPALLKAQKSMEDACDALKVKS